MPVKCLGCRLANGHESAEIVYEDEFITCLLDIAPIHEGHLLILTKKHYLDADELDGQTAAAVMNASIMLSKTLKQIFTPDGITIMQNGGLFNDLQHYHMHVFPRYESDGFSWVEPLDVSNAKDRLKETKVRIIQNIK